MNGTTNCLHNGSGKRIDPPLACPLSKRFGTLSVWKDEDALRAFVQHPPHVRVMTALALHMDKTQFARWMVKGSQLPLRWDDALRRFRTLNRLEEKW